MRFAQLVQGQKPIKQNKFYKRLSIILLILLIVSISFLAASFLTQSNNKQENSKPIRSTTSLFPVNHEVHVNNNETTNIIVDITGNSIPDNAYFTVNTTSTGADVPTDAGASLVIKGTSVVGYYDVKVLTNVTLTPDMIVKIAITNPNFNQYSTIYYWNSTQTQWFSLSTEFQSPNTVVCYMPAIDLAGTPLAITNNNSSSTNPQTNESPTPTPIITPSPTPTPTATPSPTPAPLGIPFTAPEYTWGALLALLMCFAAFAFFKAKQKHSSKKALLPIQTRTVNTQQ
jgi:hypothetical protein